MQTTAALVPATLTNLGLVAEALTAEFRAGRLRVGDLLPSEPQLSQRYGVSRQTVRAALRTLLQQGPDRLPTRHRLDGDRNASRSIPLQPVVRLRRRPAAIRDEHTGEARRARAFVVTPELAGRFGCKAGEHWWRVRTVRTDSRVQAVIAVSDIHIPLAFAAVLDELPKSRQPVFALIEKRFCQSAAEIQQELVCLSRLTRSECELLELPQRSPGLEVTRRHIGRDGRVLEVACSVHPPENFRYPMRLQLRNGGAA